jgi:hypothetical protein
MVNAIPFRDLCTFSGAAAACANLLGGMPLLHRLVRRSRVAIGHLQVNMIWKALLKGYKSCILVMITPDSTTRTPPTPQHRLRKCSAFLSAAVNTAQLRTAPPPRPHCAYCTAAHPRQRLHKQRVHAPLQQPVTDARSSSSWHACIWPVRTIQSESHHLQLVPAWPLDAPWPLSMHCGHGTSARAIDGHSVNQLGPLVHWRLHARKARAAKFRPHTLMVTAQSARRPRLASPAHTHSQRGDRPCSKHHAGTSSGARG